MYVEEQVKVPWETLKVTVADITYGGRVTDVWVRKLWICVREREGIVDEC